ncbi:MAG: chloride channel protein, partial [Desulfotomaculales bacterium]
MVFKSEELFRGIRKYFPGRAQILVPVLGGLLMGVVNFSFPLAFGRGTRGIDLSLTEQLLPSAMLLLIVLKLINISLTMGAWSTGGGFRAGLFTGAMLGGSAGALFARLAPGFTSPAGTYALVGIGGVFAGFSQAPLTAIVMISEMTKDFHLIIPLAITCVISAYTSRALTSETLYTGKLIQLGLDVFNARRSDILKNILVQDALVATVETLPAGMPVGRAYKRASSKSFESFPVINHQGALVGLVTTEDLQKAVKNGQSRAKVKDVAVGPPVTVTAKDTLQDAARKIDRLRIKCLPVVKENNPAALVGILTRDDIIRAYNRDLERVASHSPVIRKKKSQQSKAGKPEVLPHMALAATEVGLRYYNLPALPVIPTGETTGKEKKGAFSPAPGAPGQPAEATGEGGEKMPVEPE